MCDTICIVGPDATLFAKNSDRDPNEAQVLDWQPRRQHPAGSRLRCSWIEIPQAASTHAVLLSRPFWHWGAEMGTNEYGVAIGNEAVFTRQPLAASGLTGMDLVRLGLERGRSAQEAVDTIVALIQEHGQGGGCGLEHPHWTYHNSFLVADPHTALVLETAGRRYAVEEVRGSRSISNGLTIPGFAAQNSDYLKTRVCRCTTRRARTEQLARQSTGVGDLMQILRDHGTGRDQPRYSWLNGAMDCACMHAGGLVAASQTTASWISELRADGCRHWATATAAPCTGLFKPVMVDVPVSTGPDPTERADAESLWWRHERLHRLVLSNPSVLAPQYIAERNAIEAAWIDHPPEPAAAFREGDRLLAQWTSRVATLLPSATQTDCRPLVVQRYWARRNRWAELDLSNFNSNKPNATVQDIQTPAET